MKRRKKKQLQMIAILVSVLVIIVALLGLGVWGLTKLLGGKKVESLTLTPDFAETELDVNQDFTFTIKASPEKAKMKDEDLEFITDASNVTFESSGEGTAVMHTVGEGVVTVCVKLDKVESNYLSFNVVDRAAQAAAKAAEEEAAAQAAAEAEAQAEAIAQKQEDQKQAYVRTNDKVRIRKSPSTDTNDNIITTCEVGEVYLKLEQVDDWSRIVYEDGEAYIKSEFVDVLSEEEANAALEAQKNSSVEEALKKSQEAAAQAAANDPVAAAAAEAAKNQQPVAEAPAETPVVAAPAGTAINCRDGVCYVTAAQLQTIHATWDFAGDAIEMARHHTISELESVVGPTQH